MTCYGVIDGDGGSPPTRGTAASRTCDATSGTSAYQRRATCSRASSTSASSSRPSTGASSMPSSCWRHFAANDDDRCDVMRGGGHHDGSCLAASACDRRFDDSDGARSGATRDGCLGGSCPSSMPDGAYACSPRPASAGCGAKPCANGDACDRRHGRRRSSVRHGYGGPTPCQARANDACGSHSSSACGQRWHASQRAVPGSCTPSKLSCD